MWLETSGKGKIPSNRLEGSIAGMTTFHIIHIVVGLWLVAAPLLGLFTTRSALLTNNIVIGAVVALYNAWFLFMRSNTDVRNRG